MSVEQEEGVLRDVLEELDRERSKRAELEQQIRKLTDEAAAAAAKAEQQQQQQQQQRQRQQENEDSMSRKKFLSMEAQVEGYRQLVDSLTRGKPAIAAAASAASSNQRRSQQHDKRKSLPLHVVRLLEVLPWDPRAREHIFGREDIFEWQVYDVRERKWQSNLRYFPVVFKSVPIVKPKPGGGNMIEEETQNNRDRNLLLFLAGGEMGPAAPANHGVLTNERLTKVFNIESGYPLPQDGGSWQWAGGWRIEKNLVIDTAEGEPTKQMDCDENGWSYAKEAPHFIFSPIDLVWDNPGGINPDDRSKRSEPKRKVRRRKWTRQRVLVDYPYASERTQQYLQLLAENARLSATATKISDQLVETKMALTETEEKLMQMRNFSSRRINDLKEELRQKTELLQSVGMVTDQRPASDATGGDKGNPLQEFLSKNEQVKEIGSKISQWVTSARKSNDDVSPTPLNSNGQPSVSQRSSHSSSTVASMDKTKQSEMSNSAVQIGFPTQPNGGTDTTGSDRPGDANQQKVEAEPKDG